MKRYTCREDRRPIPAKVKLAVRQRSGFGCSNCGCPLIEYHHIVPYHVSADNSIENLVALCPTCHRKADGPGPWSEDYVRSLMLKPRLEHLVHGIDVVPGTFTVKLANMSFLGPEKMLTIGGMVVLGAKKEPGGIARVSGVFHDPDGEPFAVIDDNEWRVAVSKVHDVRFVAARHLEVLLAPRRVALRMEITDDFLHLQQCFFRRGDSFVKVTGDATRTLFESVSLAGARTTFRSDSARESVTFDPGKGFIVV